MKKTVHLVKLILISSCQSPSRKPEEKLEDRETILVSSIETETKEIILYSNVYKDLSLYVLRQGETKKLFYLTGKEIEAYIPLRIKVPAGFLNKKYNQIFLYYLDFISEHEIEE